PREPGLRASLVHALGLLAVLASTGCAGDYVARTRGVLQAYESGDYPRALSGLAEVERENSAKDKLLILLDRGMSLHAQGRCAESVPVLAEADRLAAELDVTSIHEEAAVLISNERGKAYRGEDFEKL